MTNSRQFLLIATLVVCSLTGNGQDCGAEAFYTAGAKACTDYIDPVKCINLDITDSFDFDGLEMKFLWEMGDGQQEEGLEINHCYDKAGKYIAALTVVDEVTKVVMKDELQVEVYIRGEFKLGFYEEAVMAGKPFQPTYELIYPENYQVTDYFWSYGDGRFSCEAKPEITYATANQFPLVLNIKIVNDTDIIYLCQQMTIDAQMPDPIGGSIEQYFEGLQADSRFLNDPAKYQLVESLNGTHRLIDSPESMVSGNSYYLLVFKGNMFLKSEAIVLPSSAGSVEKNQALITAAESAINSKPMKFEPVIFELNTSEFSKKMKKTLDRNVELFVEYPFLNLVVGSYTHTGGNYNRNMALSKDRSQLIKSYMVTKGVAEKRIAIADPSEQQTLINTCVTSGCDYEDESLNRRSDFKITGLTEFAND